jgi:hypothetical protein
MICWTVDISPTLPIDFLNQGGSDRTCDRHSALEDVDTESGEVGLFMLVINYLAHTSTRIC